MMVAVTLAAVSAVAQPRGEDAAPRGEADAIAGGAASLAFSPPRSTPFEDRGSDARLAAYRAHQAALEIARQALAERYRHARGRTARARVLDEATAALNEALVRLINPWLGTRWAFYGTSQEPGRGTIACGYFVSTLLRDAALDVERVKLAQQASERIVTTLAPADRIWRFRTGDVDKVLAKVRAQPERWFVIGLDYHVGLLLRLDDGRVWMCHSAVLSPGAATCEDAANAEAMVSTYHVVGALFTPGLVRRWLLGEAIPTDD